MKLGHIAAVLRREFQEIFKSRGLLLAIFLPPLLMTLLPLIAISFLGRAMEAEIGNSAQEFK